MTLLIDADWLLYAACSACEYDIRWDEWIHTLHLEQSDAKSYMTHQVNRWQEATGHKDVVMCLSSYPTFRHQLSLSTRPTGWTSQAPGPTGSAGLARVRVRRQVPPEPGGRRRHGDPDDQRHRTKTRSW
jgi:hypothetical protein